MSDFRGSRRLMSRIRDQLRVKAVNRTPRPSPEEEETRHRLNREAARGFAPANPTLVKQAPKQQS